MSKTETIFPFTGGMDRSATPFRADPGTFYTLQNLRQSRTERGILEQTPYFVQTVQLLQGTYYDGGSLTEPTTSHVRLLSSVHSSGNAFYVTDYCISRSASVQLQVFYQTTYPSSTTIYSGLLLVINSIAGLDITLGQTLDVEMTATAAFRWRKNGGGWTAGVPSTAGVSIDGGTATLYFLASTGYVGTEAWSWTRTDASYSTSANKRDRALPHIITRNATFFINKDDRVMVAQTSATDSVDYVISAGYKPLYANFLTVFSDHLVLLGATSPTFTANSANRERIVSWSDRGDFHNFIATDVNEADSYTLPVSTRTQNDALAGVGLGVINTTLWVFTGSECFYTGDLGLPIVFSFQQYALQHTFKVTTAVDAVIPAPSGLYLLTDSGPQFFNGASFTWVGRKMFSAFGPSAFVFGAYDFLNDELVLAGAQLLVYQVRYDSWYFRGADFDQLNTGPSAIGIQTTSRNSALRVGIRSRKVLNEDATWGGLSQAPVVDAPSNTWTIPLLLTQLIGGTLNDVKEITRVYLGATGGSSGDYASAANTRFKLYWGVSNTGTLVAVTSTDNEAYTNNSKSDGLISFPRIAFRAIMFGVSIIDNTALKPVGQCSITALEPLGLKNKAER